MNDLTLRQLHHSETMMDGVARSANRSPGAPHARNATPLREDEGDRREAVMIDQIERGFRLEVALREFCRDMKTREFFERTQRDCYFAGVWWKHVDPYLTSNDFPDLKPREREDPICAEKRLDYQMRLVQAYRMLWRLLKERLISGDYVASGVLLPNGEIEDIKPSIFRLNAGITSLAENKIAHAQYTWADVRVRKAGYLPTIGLSSNSSDFAYEGNILPFQSPTQRIQSEQPQSPMKPIGEGLERNKQNDDLIIDELIKYQVEEAKRYQSRDIKRRIIQKPEMFHHTKNVLKYDISEDFFNHGFWSALVKAMEEKKNLVKRELGEEEAEFFRVSTAGNQHLTRPWPPKP